MDLLEKGGGEGRRGEERGGEGRLAMSGRKGQWEAELKG